MSTFISAAKKFLSDEDGVTAIEYGLIAALVGVALAIAAGTLGEEVKTIFNKIANKLSAISFT
ncbi:Flp family type IVb pilin [Massilia norwichensis]|jgi:pilus assembly protein Flp/PilA|uniref:Flp family type IVb pilin n=1 Tax=Massilia norwichensis TaxID=1442366 RepID=A0ABT2A9F9_9BURK|nr:Flp family type IVb pilin [Massilia norwichensis]MCS0590727.1 Flp family type IVb pilin [Massilia norwichensis]